MAYSELIKNFQRIRDYMRQFYVYGFKSRIDYEEKSSRSYDNEKRRIESWLGEYMSFRQDSNGKAVFISIDSRLVNHNPLYQAFKTKSFTAVDITLHFYILDILAQGNCYTTKEIANIISEEYYSNFEVAEPDESTIRKKLKEYTDFGLLTAQKQGREMVYGLNESQIDIDSWKYAIDFFQEESPIGVIGSFFDENFEDEIFCFKHHYILHALDSQILYEILMAINEKRFIEIVSRGTKSHIKAKHTIFPVEIFISSQTGRQYILGYNTQQKVPLFFRLDAICEVSKKDVAQNAEEIIDICKECKKYLWGVSFGKRMIEHIEMDIIVSSKEKHIVDRLMREKRNGSVVQIAPETYRFSADVYDTYEMMPWIRTFIGRIESLKCTNQKVVDTFYYDTKKMYEMYGGDDYDI